MDKVLSWSSALALCLLMAACSNDDGLSISPSMDHGDSTLININAIVGGGTRSVNMGDTIRAGESIGLWFTLSGSTTDAYNPKKNNVRAVWTVPTETSNKTYGLKDCYWLYNYQDESAVTFTSMFIAPNKTTDSDGKETVNKMDVYAYAPYRSGLSSLSAIPFTISYNKNNKGYMVPVSLNSQTDYMYNSATNKDIEIDGGNKNVKLEFKHVLACIKVVVTNKNYTEGATDTDNEDKSSSVSKITSMALYRNTSNTSPANLYTSGTYSAIDGSVSIDESSTTNNVDTLLWNTSTEISYGTPAEIDILLAPTTYNADYDYILLFTIDNMGMTVHDGKSTGNDADGNRIAYKYEIPMSVFTDTDSKLKSGYIYTLNFTYDNYIHFTGATVDTKWTENRNDEFKRRF